jgi:hypothetical protein
MVNKDKLISFPEEILDVLEDYKQKTGIAATDYIRNALAKQMIIDKLIFFSTKYIEVEKEKQKKKTEQPIGAMYCDGDGKCNVY